MGIHNQTTLFKKLYPKQYKKNIKSYSRVMKEKEFTTTKKKIKKEKMTFKDPLNTSTLSKYFNEFKEKEYFFCIFRKMEWEGRFISGEVFYRTPFAKSCIIYIGKEKKED